MFRLLLVLLRSHGGLAPQWELLNSRVRYGVAVLVSVQDGIDVVVERVEGLGGDSVLEGLALLDLNTLTGKVLKGGL